MNGNGKWLPGAFFVLLLFFHFISDVKIKGVCNAVQCITVNIKSALILVTVEVLVTR